jgi:hypothetical protein
VNHEQAAERVRMIIDNAEGAFSAVPVKLEILRALLDGYEAAVHHCRLNCDACKHRGSVNGPCEKCYLETFQGHPEKTRRTHWEFFVPAPGREKE